MIVRLMEEVDSASVAVIEEQNFSDPWSRKGILETSAQKQAMILVAEERKEITGYLILYYALNEGEIARIAVLKKYQNQGVGSHLVWKLENICREKGITKVMLDVRAGNKNAERFYRKHGFITDGRRRHYYVDPTEDAVLMSREIN